MKKLLLSLLICSILLLCSCNKNNFSESSSLVFGFASSSTTLKNSQIDPNTINTFENISIVPQKDFYSKDDKVISLTIINDSDYELCYDEYYKLEILENGVWKQVTTKSDYAITDIASILPAHEQGALTFSLVNYFNFDFKAGKYRYVNENAGVNKNGEFIKFCLAAEFELK